MAVKRGAPKAAPQAMQAAHQAPQADVDAVVGGRHGDPFTVLGLQERDGAFVARCFIPMPRRSRR